MTGHCERSTPGSTVGITRRQRQHFMWKPTVPVTSVLSVKTRKGNNVSRTLLVAVFLPEWKHLAQMTLGSQGDRLWQRLLWTIHGPERIRIKSWHQDRLSASVPLRALGWGPSRHLAGGGCWGSGDSLSELFCNLRDLLSVPWSYATCLRGFLFYFLFLNQGQVFPWRLTTTASRSIRSQAWCRDPPAKTDGKASNQSNTITEKYTPPNEGNLRGINFLQKRKLLHLQTIFLKIFIYLFIYFGHGNFCRSAWTF